MKGQELYLKNGFVDFIWMSQKKDVTLHSKKNNQN